MARVAGGVDQLEVEEQQVEVGQQWLEQRERVGARRLDGDVQPALPRERKEALEKGAVEMPPREAS